MRLADLPSLHGLILGLLGPGDLPEDGTWVRSCLDAAIDWIQRAYAAAGDGGISKGYDLLRGRWAPSYPETTGYTIPSLLNAAAALNRPERRGRALWLAA